MCAWYIIVSRLQLTHWGRVTHICVGNLAIIGSDNGLSPGRHQAISWTNVGILLIGPLGTNFSETLIEIHTFSVKKKQLKMSSGKWGPFCLGLNVLIRCELCAVFNSLTLDRCDCSIKLVMFTLILRIDDISIICEIASGECHTWLLMITIKPLI